MGEGPLWAVAGAMIAGLFTLLAQKLRGQSDQTVAVLGQWQELLDAHKASASAEIGHLTARVGALEKELAEVRDQASRDLAEMRKQHASEIDEMRKQHRAELRGLRDLNEGLQRMIAQNSKSTVQLMGDTPVTPSLRRALPPREDGEDSEK